MFAGRRADKAAGVDTLQIGPLPFKGWKFGVLPPDPGSAMPQYQDRPVVGLLGLDVVGSTDFELNIAARKMTFFSQEHCAGRVVYWTKTYTPVPFQIDPVGGLHFPVEIAGENLDTTVSPISTTTLADANVTRLTLGFDEKSAGTVSEPSGPGGAAVPTRSVTLSMAGYKLENSKLQIFPGPQFCGHAKQRYNHVVTNGYENCPGSFPVQLGLNALSTLRIFFAIKERTMYVSAADAS